MTPVTQPTDNTPTTSAPTTPTPTAAGTTTTGAQAGVRPGPLTAAKAPVGPGLITVVGVVLASGLLALGVVALHDALIATGLVAGPAWIETALTALDGLEPAPWMVPAAVAMVIIGAGALVIALRPRPSTAIALRASTGVYLRPRDVARLARAATLDVDGVTSATATATRRTVTLTVRATTPDHLTTPVQHAVTHALDALATTPKIRVKLTPERGPR